MKIILLFFFLICSANCIAQKSEFFNGVDFDSSYCVVGLVQGYNKQVDSLPKYWFVLDDPADMIQLKKEWVFKNEAQNVSMELPTIDIYILRNKMEVIPGSIIYPRQGLIKSGKGWYKFDMKQIEKLHNAHPLHYHTQIYRFDSFKQYVSFGNKLLADSNLLFFFEPSLKYEGHFYIYAELTNDPDSPMWVLSDVDKLLKKLAVEGTYESGVVLNDTFNLTHRDKTRISVYGPKSLYDKFESKIFEKGEWALSAIEMKVFWRD